MRVSRARNRCWLLAACGVGLTVGACATPEGEGEPTPPVPEPVAVEVQPADGQVAVAGEAETETATVTDETTPTTDEAVDSPPDEEFVVTEELYDRTFDEVGELIAHLNEIISRRDFQSWHEFLTPDYIIASTDPEYLQRLEQLGPLRRNNVKLGNLEDFFTHVVVPSRSSVVLDSVEFVDQDRVKAISQTSQGPGVLYFLVRSDRGWQIGVF